MKTVRTLHVDSPPERVLATLASEPFNVEVEQKREGVVSTTFRTVEGGDDPVVELRTTEYARTKLGKLDKSATFQSVTTSRVDSRARALAWTYEGGEGMTKRFRLSGVYRVAPERGGTLLTHEINIEVDIPLVGNQIAKLVAKELDDTMPVIAEALERHMV